jgi:hypothetical protein
MVGYRVAGGYVFIGYIGCHCYLDGTSNDFFQGNNQVIYKRDYVIVT